MPQPKPRPKARKGKTAKQRAVEEAHLRQYRALLMHGYVFMYSRPLPAHREACRVIGEYIETGAWATMLPPSTASKAPTLQQWYAERLAAGLVPAATAAGTDTAVSTAAARNAAALQEMWVQPQEEAVHTRPVQLPARTQEERTRELRADLDARIAAFLADQVCPHVLDLDDEVEPTLPAFRQAMARQISEMLMVEIQSAGYDRPTRERD